MIITIDMVTGEVVKEPSSRPTQTKSKTPPRVAPNLPTVEPQLVPAVSHKKIEQKRRMPSEIARVKPDEFIDRMTKA